MIAIVIILIIVAFFIGYHYGCIRGRFQVYREMEVPLNNNVVYLDTIDSN